MGGGLNIVSPKMLGVLLVSLQIPAKEGPLIAFSSGKVSIALATTAPFETCQACALPPGKAKPAAKGLLLGGQPLFSN